MPHTLIGRYILYGDCSLGNPGSNSDKSSCKFKESNCKYEEPKIKPFLVLSVAFCSALGAGLAGLFFKPLNSLLEKDATFIYVDSGTNNLKFVNEDPKSNEPPFFYRKYSSIVLRNEGDKAGIVTYIKINGGKQIEQFYASHTATDLKLRKKEFQKSEALVCPPKTYCEITFEGEYKVTKLEISNGLKTDELKI